MKNLDELGVQEMDVREMKEENGGFWWLLAGALVGAALTQDLDDLGEAFSDGWNQR